MQDIQPIVNYLKERAMKAMRQNGGDLEPKMYFLILYPGQKTPVYFPVPCSRFFENDDLKNKLYIYVQMAWDKKKAESPKGIELKAVCVISDMWFSVKKVPANLTTEEAIQFIESQSNELRPSKDPNRLQCVSININLPEEAYSMIIPYLRKGKNIEFQQEFDQSKMESLGGRMLELFPANL